MNKFRGLLVDNRMEGWKWNGELDRSDMIGEMYPVVGGMVLPFVKLRIKHNGR